jgi:hypothetical protein
MGVEKSDFTHNPVNECFYGLLATVTARGHNGREPELLKQPFIPRDATVADLKRNAECEQKPASKEEPRATELRKEANLYREWATTLRWGQWTS